MSIQTGTAVILKAAGNAIAASRSLSISISANMIELSNKDDGGWMKQKPGKKSFTMSLDGVVDFTDINGRQAIEDALLAGTELAFVWGPATPTTGDLTFTGSILTESVELTAPDDEAAGYSISFQGTGTLTKTIN